MPCRRVSRAAQEPRARTELGRRVLLRESTQAGQRRRRPRGAVGALPPLLDRLLSARVAGRTRAPTIPPPIDSRKSSASQARYLRTIADDRGRLPLLGDDDGGQLFGDLRRASCGRGADAERDRRRAERPALAVAPADEEVHWILGRRPAVSLEPRRADVRGHRRRSCRSGYFVSRNRRGDHLVFDAGPHGYLNGGHSHADALSSCSRSTASRCWSIPALRPTPSTPRCAIAFRSTRMHNTVVIDGPITSQPRGPFQWSSAAPRASVLSRRIDTGVDFVQATHNAYAGAAARPVDLRACMDRLDGSSSTMSLAPESDG